MINVESESIHSIEYFEEEQVLEVRFHSSNKIYAYYDVPPGVYEEFMQSDSLGRYYATNIKGYYASQKLP